MTTLTEAPSREDLLREREAVEAELCRRSLKLFVQRAWRYVIPDRPFIDNWHIGYLCETLEAVTAGEILRLLVNLPPGTSKTIVALVLWPAWEWTRQASLQYFTASYSDHLTIKANLDVRALVESAWYQRHFKVRFSGDQNAKEWVKTTAGGWRFATSINGAGTGEHPDRILVTDPLKAQESRSKTALENVNDWFDRTVSSRGIMKNARLVVEMQRLAKRDLSGHLLERGGWHHLCLPMRYEKARPATEVEPAYTPDPRDPRTEEGQLLVPQMIGEDKVRQLEIDLNPQGARAQLQQQPGRGGAGLFKREWFRVVEHEPEGCFYRRGWDTAVTENDGDYTAGVKIAMHEAETGLIDPKTKTAIIKRTFYVCDVVHDQLGPAAVDDLIRATAQQDGHDVGQREEEEKASAGKNVIAIRQKGLPGIDYQGVKISGDKVVRANPFRAQCESGNVFLVRAAWNDAYLSELADFPGEHDDQVDASSAAFNALMTEPRKKKRKLTW